MSVSRALNGVSRLSIIGAAALIPCTALAQSPGTSVPAYSSDSFENAETATLVQRARERHQSAATQLAGYRAKVLSKVERRVAPSRYGRGLTVFKYETAARVHWVASGDIRVNIDGARMASLPMPGFGRDQAAAFFTDIFGDQVWFIPSSIGDEIELLGLPDRAALHPLARDAARYYRYAITDTLELAYMQRRVRVIGLRVTPLGFPRGQPVFQGRMWIDADSLDVVRLTGAFVGDGIWDEDDDAPELISLEADIEYSLYDNRFWLPRRQVLSVNWVYKYLPGASLPGEAVIMFSDYEIDRAASEIAFADGEFPRSGRYSRGTNWGCPDAWEFAVRRSPRQCGQRAAIASGTDRDGQHWEITLPTIDSLERYDFGTAWEGDPGWSGNERLRESLHEMAAVGAGVAAPTRGGRHARSPMLGAVNSRADRS